jgi:hypothetical protein
LIFPVRFGRGDSLLVFDPSSRRLSVLSPVFELVRTTPLPAYASAAVHFADGSVVINASIMSKDLAGVPLHHVSASGAIRRSFGSDKSEARPELALATSRRLAPAGQGAFWSAHATRYTIERWDTTGALRATLEVPTPWFAPWRERKDGDPPKPTIIDLQLDNQGLLWVLLSVADARHKPPARSVAGTPARIDRDAEFDSVLEVIDPATAQVITSTRMEESMRGFGCAGVVFSSSEDSEGYPLVRLWSVALARP